MKEKSKVLDYAYERQSAEDVQTYTLIKENETLLLIPDQHYYFSILGEKTIEKLVARGYLSVEELHEKYANDTIEKQPIKTKKRR